MKRLIALCTVGLICLLGTSALWAASAITLDMPQINPAESKAHLQVERLNATRTHVRLDNPEITPSEHWVDFQRLQSFAIEGESRLPKEDRPALPQVSRFYQIPDRGQVHVELGALEYDVIDNVDALPLALEDPSFQQLRRDADVYAKNAWYPAEVAVLSSPVIFRDLRLVQLSLYPVQVNPVTHQARVYRNLNAQIVATEEPGENEILNPRPLTGSYIPMYRQMVANLDETQLAGATNTPGSILILCTADSVRRAYADSLFVWKTRKGFRTVVDSRSNWSAVSMKSAIQAAYNTWDPPLEFVILVGDPAQAATGVPVDGSSYDHSYALLAGNDELEDVGVGRLSGASDLEMAIINAKIMGYERTPYMGDDGWYGRGFFYGGVAHTIASNYTLMQWAAQQFRTWTGIKTTTVATHSGAVSESLIQTQFASGLAFFLWRGSWLSEMDNGTAGTTNPGFRLPVCLCVTCGANNYDSGLGTAESYLVAGGSVNQPKGGVASVGTATSGTHAPQNITFFGGTVFAIANQGVESFGHAVSAGKAWLAATFGPNDSETLDFSRWNNLMGDPSLSMWTDTPVSMSAVHPAILSVGARSVTVNVRRTDTNAPIADALVTLWKRGSLDSTWVRGRTDSQGQVILPVAVRMVGNMFVTITKQNHKPYLSSLPCQPAAQMAMVSTCALDDDNVGGTSGNGNGRLNPGEIIDLPLRIRNFGISDTARSVTVTLSCANPRVTILQPTATYPSIAAGDSALPEVPFRISASTLLQNDEPVVLSAAIVTDGGPTTGALFLRTEGAAFVSSSLVFTEGPLLPGTTRTLSLTLRNSGTLPLTSVTAHLLSRSPFVLINDADASFGAIASGAQATCAGDPFTLVANPLTYRGSQAPMLLIVNTAEGATDSLAFNVNIGTAAATDPTGPDAFGYYAYDNSDTAYRFHPTFNYLNISAVAGANLNLVDVGEKNDYLVPPTSTARALPFPFKFYGQVYDSITICSNGWCAFGNQAWNDNFRNYDIPAMQAPQAMIAPFWQDLCTTPAGMGVWMHAYPDSHFVVIQWKANQLTSSGGCTGAAVDFEVILRDPAYFPTDDGNGQILVQYQTASTSTTTDISREVPGCGIGIQDVRGLTGLAYYNNPAYLPGAATVGTGRAILFTTDGLILRGNLDGLIVDAANSLPLAGAVVSFAGTSYVDTSDINGHYTLPRVLVGTYDLEIVRPGYNPYHLGDLQIHNDSTSVINAALLHPAMTFSEEVLRAQTYTEPVTVPFTITNPGNGPLEFTSALLYGGDTSEAPCDSVNAIATSTATGDFQMWGCEFVGDSWWVTGGSGPGNQNVVYQFNRAGQLLGHIPQGSTSSFGWFDMAFDGQRLYGSDGAFLRGIDPAGQLEADSIPAPLNPCRAIAYDPDSDHFWVAEYGEDIYEIDRTGATVNRFPNDGANELSITGLAWNTADPDGYKLYIFSQNGTQLSRLTRLNPLSGQRAMLDDLAAGTGDRAAGFGITATWNYSLLVCAAVLQNSSGDRLQVYELAFDHSWIGVTPASDMLAAGDTREITVTLNPGELPDGLYRADIRVYSAVMGTSRVMPVEFTVGDPIAIETPVVALPAVYRLHQNFPNPFNPTTTIRYELKSDGLTRLRVYNLMGQQVADLVNTRQAAGVYTVAFDASALPSGMYFYRLESDDFVSTHKMVLMK